MILDICVTTDYAGWTGCPKKPLRLIAEAGFSHVHWCHHYNSDFVYQSCEIDAIVKWLREYGLQLLDVHGSYGQEKRWWSLREYERLAGVELVKNRIELFCRLEGTGAVIMHLPYITVDITPENEDIQRREFEAVLRSLDEIVPYMEKRRVRLALENMPDDTWELLDAALKRYPAATVGLCYDSGHGNFVRKNQFPDVERHLGRLYALHLDDNNGYEDQHQPPFMGSVDWERMARIIRASCYRGPLSFEISTKGTPCHVPGWNIPEAAQQSFLHDAYERCRKVAEMVL